MRSKIKKVLFYSMWLLNFSIKTVFYLFISLPLRFSKKYSDMWIIGERPDEARDNGYWLYLWILKNRPDINVYFVLSRKSADYDKMPRKDLIIEPGSAKHYIYYILSSYSVSTHMHGCCPGKSFCIPFLPFMRRKKTVFLQHGVAKDLLKLRGGLDAIVASSNEEKRLLVRANPRYKNNIHVVGLCRYDHLKDLSHSQKEKIILVMPTFRRWLRDIARLKNADEAFRRTDYYRKWNSLLNNDELLNLLEENNMKMIFFPHKEMQVLAKNFSANNKRVIIGKPGEYDIQRLLRKSSILITDYSSVSFDFCYMRKPVVYYQFDKNDFFSRHYASSGKDYPFGKTVVKESELVDEVSEITERGCLMKTSFSLGVEKFFKYNDESNCERNFNMIIGDEKDE